MTPDELESQAANRIMREAYDLAVQNNKHIPPVDGVEADKDTAALAILLTAIELLTPDWSPEARARLFTGDEE